MVSPFDERMHVFIVRFWRETREIPGAKAEWRGVVEHVPSGERRYAKNLSEIMTFVAQYVPDMTHESSDE